jgi:hypothetical protein
VFTQAFPLRVFAQQLPGIVTSRHNFLDTMLQDEEHESKSEPLQFAVNRSTRSEEAWM